MTTRESITDEQIRALGREAGMACDHEMVETCHEALDGDEAAVADCVRAIRRAEAMADDA